MYVWKGVLGVQNLMSVSVAPANVSLHWRKKKKKTFQNKSNRPAQVSQISLDEMKSRMYCYLTITIISHAGQASDELPWHNSCFIIQSEVGLVAWRVKGTLARRDQLKPLRIPLMSIHGCLGMPWATQHGWDLQPLNWNQLRRLHHLGFIGGNNLLNVFETALQLLYRVSMIRRSWTRSVTLFWACCVYHGITHY